MKLNDKVYDVLKWVALLGLNTIGLCYKSIAGIWGLPYGDMVADTCAAFAICIGGLIGISTIQYNKDKEAE